MPEIRKPETRETRLPNRVGVPSIISADMVVTGNLRTEGDVQVDGVVEGDIFTGSLTIGESGKVIGQVQADTVRVHGALEGTIIAREVSLLATARVNGDIEHEALEVVMGSHFEGNVRRRRMEAGAATTPAEFTPSNHSSPAKRLFRPRAAGSPGLVNDDAPAEHPADYPGLDPAADDERHAAFGS